jgi:hypothetical protein
MSTGREITDPGTDIVSPVAITRSQSGVIAFVS